VAGAPAIVVVSPASAEVVVCPGSSVAFDDESLLHAVSRKPPTITTPHNGRRTDIGCSLHPKNAATGVTPLDDTPW
jgi:hypothetical protein